jgi:hypothetical protein
MPLGAVNQPSYLARLTLAEVRACALEAERLFQRDPHVVPARTAAAWARLAELMERAAASVVGGLGPQATSEWETELGFSATGKTWDDDWPRDRDALGRVRAQKDEP